METTSYVLFCSYLQTRLHLKFYFWRKYKRWWVSLWHFKTYISLYFLIFFPFSFFFLVPISISSFPSDDYRFVENTIIILRYIHSIISVFGSFIINRCWFWLNVFSGSCDLCLKVFLDLLICVWNQSCIPGMKSVWSCYMIFLMCYWIHKNALRICASMFMKEIWLQLIICFLLFLFCLDVGVIWASLNDFGSVPSLSASQTVWKILVLALF